MTEASTGIDAVTKKGKLLPIRACIWQDDHLAPFLLLATRPLATSGLRAPSTSMSACAMRIQEELPEVHVACVEPAHSRAAPLQGSLS